MDQGFYILRNGTLVVLAHPGTSPEVTTMAPAMLGNTPVPTGQTLYLASLNLLDPLTWAGGGFGPEFDVVEKTELTQDEQELLYQPQHRNNESTRWTSPR